MKKAREISNQIALVRKALYGLSHQVKQIEECKFKEKLADNPDNKEVLKRYLMSEGVHLIIAPTGSGKTYLNVQAAYDITGEDDSARVIIACSSVALARQIAKYPNVSEFIGSSEMIPASQIISCTYEKLSAIKASIDSNKLLGKKQKNYLIIDECHTMSLQQEFRKETFSSLFSFIEEDVFESVSLVTATPNAMTLFRIDSILEFTSLEYQPAMGQISIIEVDDVMEYIRDIDLESEYPFIRLNSKDKIQQLTGENPKLIGLNSGEKQSPIYKDIVKNARISRGNSSGIISTSLIQEGVSILDYPADMSMIFIADVNMSMDDIEQFLSRCRRTDSLFVKQAKIIVPKKKSEGTGFRAFIRVLNYNLTKMDSFANGISEIQESEKRFEKTARLSESLSNDEVAEMIEGYKKTVDSMILSGIESLGELKICASYENGQVLIDKRLVYMVSRKQFERQYLYHLDEMKLELEKRFNVPITSFSIDTDVSEQSICKNTNIWENMESVRNTVICDEDYYTAIMQDDRGNKYLSYKEHSPQIYYLKRQKHIMELLKMLGKTGISGEMALKVLINSNTKKKCTEYKNMVLMIRYNKYLDFNSKTGAEDEHLIEKSRVDNRLQTIIFFFIKQRGKSCFQISDNLVSQIIEYYEEKFPEANKPTSRAVKMKLKQMYPYKNVATDYMKSSVRLNEADAFKLVSSDFEQETDS